MNNHQTDKPDKFDMFIRVSLFLMAVAALYLLFVSGPNFLRARASRQFTACESNLKNIGAALEMYAGANDRNYPPSLTVLTPGYLQTIPTCSSSGTNRGYIDSYRVSKDFKAYTFYCPGDSHSAIGNSINFPQYNSREGLIYSR